MSFSTARLSWGASFCLACMKIVSFSSTNCWHLRSCSSVNGSTSKQLSKSLMNDGFGSFSMLDKMVSSVHLRDWGARPIDIFFSIVSTKWNWRVGISLMLQKRPKNIRICRCDGRCWPIGLPPIGVDDKKQNRHGTIVGVICGGPSGWLQLSVMIIDEYRVSENRRSSRDRWIKESSRRKQILKAPHSFSGMLASRSCIYSFNSAPQLGSVICILNVSDINWFSSRAGSLGLIEFITRSISNNSNAMGRTFEHSFLNSLRIVDRLWWARENFHSRQCRIGIALESFRSMRICCCGDSGCWLEQCC